MWGISFRIRSPFGHFRNPYTTTLKQTYPFPPKPTIIGMVGAMLGWDEKTVIEETGNFKIAIPFWKNRGKIIEFTFIFSAGKIKGKSRTQKKFRPERFELLLYPEFEIIVLNHAKEVIEEIAQRIKEKDFSFPLFMGKNEFLITDIYIIKKLFETEICKINAPTGIVFKEGNEIPEFSSLSDKPRPAEVFIGVPKSLKLVGKKREQKEVCTALVPKETIKLKESLDGIKINGCEYTII
ncbi:MAG: CRISPR-associated protein Cas5 [Thermosulfidibacteraceae bacterium]|jgi:CRISPR-associated protein Cas5 subtype I-B|uniref:CRISPR-associated protein Cas5 n=1 Tax=Thermovenabulum sp. TaxID=3100335 RepID=UPI003C7D4167